MDTDIQMKQDLVSSDDLHIHTTYFVFQTHKTLATLEKLVVTYFPLVGLKDPDRPKEEHWEQDLDDYAIDIKYYMEWEIGENNLLVNMHETTLKALLSLDAFPLSESQVFELVIVWCSMNDTAREIDNENKDSCIYQSFERLAHLIRYVYNN